MLSYELREQVILAIDEAITLAELEEWIVPRLPLFLERPDSDDAEMIAAIEMALAEVGNSLIDELEARTMLRESLDHLGKTVATPVQVGGYVRTIVTGSTSQSLVRRTIGVSSMLSYTTQP